MNVELVEFLREHPAWCQEVAEWEFDGQPLPLAIGTHLCHLIPPADQLITSVRAVVIKDDSVLVVRDPDGCHLLPGGRREPSESCAQCVQREVLEETGCQIVISQPIAFMHFLHQGPKPAEYPYPYPDFLQVVFAAQFLMQDDAARVPDEWVCDSFFASYDRMDELEVSQRDRSLLVPARQIAGTLDDD